MKNRNTLTQAFTLLWLPVVAIIAWWVVSSDSANFYFPPLAEIVATIQTEALEGSLWENITFSLMNFVIGFLSASVAGVTLGIVLGSLRHVREILSPLLDFMRAMPQIALVPVVIMIFGLGPQPKMFLIGFICFWPILLNAIDGVRGLNPQQIEVARAYRVPYPLFVLRMLLPGATPSIMAGMRISIGLGVVMMVVSEMYSSTRGIGFYILQSQESYRVVDVWAGTIVIGLIGYAISILFIVLERRILSWYHQTEPKARPRRGKVVTLNRSTQKHTPQQSEAGEVSKITNSRYQTAERGV